MPETKAITIASLINMAEYEIIRLDYARSVADRHNKELREFAEYCESAEVDIYKAGCGVDYFLKRYGIDLSKSYPKLTSKQRDTRCTLQLLDDIYQFGYGRRNSSQNFRNTNQYYQLVEDYLKYCGENGIAKGSIREKNAKIWQFLFFLEGRRISLKDINPAVISEFMTTLSGSARSTINVTVSSLRCFFKYLQEIEVIDVDLSNSIPKPKIYAEEKIPEVWTVEEIQKLLSVIDRCNSVGKRDYAMILLAVMLGMRAGDICSLKFNNIDWKRKYIHFIQQKTKKETVLPLLAEVGDAIIDYLKNGRLESDSDCIFLRHLSPYGPFLSSSALSCVIKKYMRYAGISPKERKAAHSFRHTLASSMLKDKVPIVTIADVLGQFNTKTTIGYTKVDITALRQCTLSFGGKEIN